MNKIKNYIQDRIKNEIESHSINNWQGYTIFFDEKENEFGLGLKSPEGKLTFIGYYGGFIETLNGM